VNDFDAAARDARSIGTDLAMLQAAIDARQPAPALAGGILDAARRIIAAFGGQPAPLDTADLGILAYDISEAIDKNAQEGLDLPDIGQDDIEPNLPAFLAACQATADGVPVPAVHVEVRTDYGTPRVYPANKWAHLFTALTGTKTFTELHLSAIRDLGYQVLLTTPDVAMPAGFTPADGTP